ncbi:hypothetical protein V6N12_018156 [Hibiscus sabdariffa]|uniref:Uncharacterized protein n=1 Tax=Hibiscus sabdariffa TaxID=183260 RepID=A0ABR2BQ37_9ROSI
MDLPLIDGVEQVCMDRWSRECSQHTHVGDTDSGRGQMDDMVDTPSIHNGGTNTLEQWSQSGRSIDSHVQDSQASSHALSNSLESTESETRVLIGDNQVERSVADKGMIHGC